VAALGGGNFRKQALEEWRTFQALVVRNLLPAGEAGELVSYAEAIVRAGG
jgi:hypothetical protein